MRARPRGSEQQLAGRAARGEVDLRLRGLGERVGLARPRRAARRGRRGRTDRPARSSSISGRSRQWKSQKPTTVRERAHQPARAHSFVFAVAIAVGDEAAERRQRARGRVEHAPPDISNTTSTGSPAVGLEQPLGQPLRRRRRSRRPRPARAPARACPRSTRWRSRGRAQRRAPSCTASEPTPPAPECTTTALARPVARRRPVPDATRSCPGRSARARCRRRCPRESGTRARGRVAYSRVAAACRRQRDDALAGVLADPATSRPGTSGSSAAAEVLVPALWVSAKFSPRASTAISTSPAPACGRRSRRARAPRGRRTRLLDRAHRREAIGARAALRRPMSLTVVGSIAYDAVKTPFGERERMLGGAATHFALAASFFDEVRVVGPVGDDFGEEQFEMLRRAARSPTTSSRSPTARRSSGAASTARTSTRARRSSPSSVFERSSRSSPRRSRPATSCSSPTSSPSCSSTCASSAATPASSRSTRWTCGSTSPATRSCR